MHGMDKVKNKFMLVVSFYSLESRYFSFTVFSPLIKVQFETGFTTVITRQ